MECGGSGCIRVGKGRGREGEEKMKVMWFRKMRKGSIFFWVSSVWFCSEIR